MPPRILVIEDDSSILLGLREKLRLEGYEVVEAVDGEAARDRLADGALDLVILDLMLPKLDGLTVLRWLRKRGFDLPVLILSARGSEDEKVEGLRAGADDYLAKPFGLKELMARVEALLRRRPGGGETFAAGDLTVDVAGRRVFRGGEEVSLSRKELDVLLFLVRNQHRVVTREQILAGVWGHFSASNARAVDFHVLNLRRKLEADPGSPRHIVTRHGVGFQIVP